MIPLAVVGLPQRYPATDGKGGSRTILDKVDLSLPAGSFTCLLRIWRERTTTIVFVTHDIDEAAYLAERVVLLSPGQGRITHDLKLALPRPCQRTDSAFLAARREIFAAFQMVHESSEDYAI